MVVSSGILRRRSNCSHNYEAEDVSEKQSIIVLRGVHPP